MTGWQVDMLWVVHTKSALQPLSRKTPRGGMKIAKKIYQEKKKKKSNFSAKREKDIDLAEVRGGESHDGAA